MDDKLVDEVSISQQIPFKERYKMLSPENKDVTFLYIVEQSSKNLFKLSLYLMDADTRIGLLRVDYSGQHENHQTISEHLPAEFHPYVGKFFNYNEHHIHYYVQGYRNGLDWALPISETEFPIKEIKENKDILAAFISFNSLINLRTKFNINQLIL
jgi:hypothetical protein